MSRPFFDDEDAQKAAERPPFVWNGTPYAIAPTGFVIVWDDPGVAEEIAAALGTYAKHSEPRHQRDRVWWTTFSIVRLTAG